MSTVLKSEEFSPERPLTDEPFHEQYRHMQPQPTEKPVACPLCGGDAIVWEFSESMDSTVTRVVMCEHGDAIGPQDGLVNCGCLLYMPPDQFYRATGRDAVNYWNRFALALDELRALKQPPSEVPK